VPREKNLRIQISLEDKKTLVYAGYLENTVRGWFFKESGPKASKLEDIEEILGRKVETIPVEEEEEGPKIFIHEIHQEGTGFCWVPFSAWEGFTKKEVCELCVKKNTVCRKKAEAAA
jgi:hypothetical protein